MVSEKDGEPFVSKWSMWRQGWGRVFWDCSMRLGAMSLSLTRYNFTVIIVFRVSSSPAIPFLFLFALVRIEQHFRNSYPAEQDVGLKKREGQDDQCGRRGH
jgi:hypothetical protein